MARVVSIMPCICACVVCTCIAPRLLFDKLREEGAIILADQEARELALEPIGETARELGIMAILQTLEQKRAQQHLAAGIDRTFLLREPGLKRLLPRLELRNAFGNGPSGHDENLPLVTPGEPDPAFMARLAKAMRVPCQAERRAVGQVAVGNSHREAEIRRIEDSQGRTYELGPTRIAENAA